MLNTFIDKYFTHQGTSKISKFEFVLLHGFSQGIYGAYWAWAAWETARLSEKRKYKFTSSLRAALLPFTSFWLYPKLAKISKTDSRILFISSIGLFASLWIIYLVSPEYHYYLTGIVLYTAVSMLQAIIMWPAIDTQHKASTKAKRPKGNNPVLAVVLSVFFALSFVSYFVVL